MKVTPRTYPLYNLCGQIIEPEVAKRLDLAAIEGHEVLNKARQSLESLGCVEYTQFDARPLLAKKDKEEAKRIFKLKLGVTAVKESHFFKIS